MGILPYCFFLPSQPELFEYTPTNHGPTETGPEERSFHRKGSLVYRWGYCSTAVISPPPRNRLTEFACGVFPLSPRENLDRRIIRPRRQLGHHSGFSLACVMTHLITQEFGCMSSLPPLPLLRTNDANCAKLTYLVDEMRYLGAN